MIFDGCRDWADQVLPHHEVVRLDQRVVDRSDAQLKELVRNQRELDLAGQHIRRDCMMTVSLRTQFVAV